MSTRTAPHLPAPEAQTESQALAVTDRPDSIMDVEGQGFMAGFDLVHAGGALPSLFPEDARKGDVRVVKYLSYEVVDHVLPGKNKKNESHQFAALVFDVLNPQDGKVRFRASLPCSTTLMDYFGFQETDGGGIDTSKARNPDKTPLLAIVYGGRGPGKPGMAPPHLWIVNELVPKDAPKGKGDAKRK